MTKEISLEILIRNADREKEKYLYNKFTEILESLLSSKKLDYIIHARENDKYCGIIKKK